MDSFSPKEMMLAPGEDRRDRRAARRIAYIDAFTRLVSVCQPTFRVGLLLVASAQFAHRLHL